MLHTVFATGNQMCLTAVLWMRVVTRLYPHLIAEDGETPVIGGRRYRADKARRAALKAKLHSDDITCRKVEHAPGGLSRHCRHGAQHGDQ